MTDVSHLEKMGRELKCPICLSLLKSAASISCNHVFCNACILKSMKKESNCPVCKVPFRRREIRPAPHMDNLVEIYKSMETASGVNMFMSESAPSSQLPEKNAEPLSHVQNDTQRYSDNHVRSSFPSQKRVQVARYPLPETPVHSAKIRSKNSENKSSENQINMLSSKAKADLNDRHGTCLTPFFWLRDDEDAEDLSQPSEGTYETDASPPAALSFSDMKDSDYDSTCKENTQGESWGIFPAVDLSDNDMFQWTQRPCSPKLLSSTVQIKSVQEKQPGVASQARNTNGSDPLEKDDQIIIGQGTRLATMCQPDAVDKKPKARNPSKEKSNTMKPQTASKKSAIRRGTRLKIEGALNKKVPVLKSHSNLPNSEETVIKRQKRTTKFETMDELAHEGIPSEPGEKDVSTGFPNLLEKDSSCKSKSTTVRCLRSRKRKRELSKVVGLENLSVNENNDRNVGDSASCLADDCLTLKMQRKTPTNEPSKAEVKESQIEVSPVCKTKSCLRSSRKVLKPTKTVSCDDFPGHENKQSGQDKLQSVIEDCCPSNGQHDMSATLPPNCLSDVKDSPAVLPFTVADDHLVSRRRLGKYHSLTKRSNVIRGFTSNISDKGSITHGAPSTFVQNPGNIEGISEEVANDSTMQEKVISPVKPINLQNSESNLNIKKCAFCQSADDSVPYGKMIHYCDGRPVSINQTESSNLIHCHQICAEWAPKVYFKKDIAINLKAEIARSKKISCGCCGVKGAALGCYHKSCHRSFHVPCAKLMPECRWDSENYVMLCPLHASSKLPCELPGSQRKRKRSCNTSMQESVMTTDTPKSDWNRNSHRSSEKIVLCCSALDAEDKDVVAQFKTLSGTRESNKWSSSVTHVIASVDENEACRRTLKVLMGILEGKWILSFKWIKACVDAKKLVDEKHYEINVDIHGVRGGPRLGRLRALNKEPKLFHGLEFYFFGDFAASYKGYLQDLITAGGGTILHRKPIVADHSRPSTFIIYNLENEHDHDHSNNNKDTLLHKRISQATALANSTGAKAVSNAWILNSIAACQLQNSQD